MKSILINLLFILTFSSSVYCQNYKFGKVSKEELAQKEYSLEPEAVAAVLNRETATRFDYTSEEGFFILTEVVERIKINKKDGFDYGTIKVKLYKGKKGIKEEITGLKGFTYNIGATGKIEKTKLKSEAIFEKDISNFLSELSFTFPNLKEGSVIEYKYTFKSPFITNINAYIFQELIPVKNVNLVFKAPEYLVYKTHRTGAVNFTINTNTKERTLQYSYTSIGVRNGGGADKSIQDEIKFTENIYTVNLTNVPSLKVEAFSGNIHNYLSKLKFELAYTKFPNAPFKNYTTNWEAVTKSIYESPNFGSELKKENYFKKDIDNLLSGISSENDKIIKIFEYVKHKIKWNSFYGKYTNKGVRSAYKTQEGNVAEINLMLTAMLRYAGINARPILTSTKSNGIPVFPTANGFNYVIAGIEIPDGVILLDATNKLGNINLLKPELINWKGRLIRKDNSSAWVSLVPKKHSVESILIQSQLNENNEITGTVQQRTTSLLASEVRKKYLGEPQSNRIKILQEDLENTEIKDLSFENLDNVYKPVSIKYSFTNPDAVEKLTDKIIINPLIFLGKKENPFKLENRTYPVDFGYPFKHRMIINIKIPDTYSVESMPESANFAFGNNDGVFRFNISESNGSVQVMVDFAINTPIITPDLYANLKGFYQLILEKENEKIVLTKQ